MSQKMQKQQYNFIPDHSAIKLFFLFPHTETSRAPPTSILCNLPLRNKHL